MCGKDNSWTLNRRKALIAFLDAVEFAIDQSTFPSWVAEFDRKGFAIVQHLVSSAVTVTKEDIGGIVEEAAITSNELVSRLLFVANHGLSGYSSPSTVAMEELEFDQSIIRLGSYTF